jgi:ferredoxin-NADP reductase
MSFDKTKLCHELKVTKKIQETIDTVSVVFEIPEQLKSKFQYKSGQFVTLFLTINDEEIRRSYSLASSPLADTDFKISVKLVPGGRASTYLVEKLQPGAKLWVTPPAGHFCLPEKAPAKQKYLFYAAGSGITPVISLIKTALKTSTEVTCGLLYQNRNFQNIIFKDELENVMAHSSSRFTLDHILSKSDDHWMGRKGRTDKETVKDFMALQKSDGQTIHFLCGPTEFMNAVETALLELKIDKNNIRKESFATVAAPAGSTDTFKLDKDSIVIGDPKLVSTPETIEVKVDGQTTTVKYVKGETILQTLLDAGLNPPYSCMDGACMACMAKIEEGVVYQNDLGILSDDNIDAGECLTCQARPAAKKVKVNYEIF